MEDWDFYLTLAEHGVGGMKRRAVIANNDPAACLLPHPLNDLSQAPHFVLGLLQQLRWQYPLQSGNRYSMARDISSLR